MQELKVYIDIGCHGITINRKDYDEQFLHDVVNFVIDFCETNKSYYWILFEKYDDGTYLARSLDYQKSCDFHFKYESRDDFVQNFINDLKVVPIIIYENE